MREPGYYWIQLQTIVYWRDPYVTNAELEKQVTVHDWRIAEWNGNEWGLTGTDYPVDNEEIHEIDERRIIRSEP